MSELSRPRPRRVAASIVVALTLACQGPLGGSRPGDAAASRVPLISPRALVETLQRGESVVFLDVREPQEFAESHIPGALNIPQRELAERIGEVDPQALVIPYCNMDFRGFYAVRELRALGIERIALMQARGIYGWRRQGLPVAGGERGLSDEAARTQLLSVDPDSLLPRAKVATVPPTGRTRHIRITAASWYFDPNDLEVDAGDTIHLILESEQGSHYFVQPDYELAVALPEGATREVTFLADRPGEFRFGSCEWDGSALQVMKGRLRVRGEE